MEETKVQISQLEGISEIIGKKPPEETWRVSDEELDAMHHLKRRAD
jgi:hypothetical protein